MAKTEDKIVIDCGDRDTAVTRAPLAEDEKAARRDGADEATRLETARQADVATRGRVLAKVAQVVGVSVDDLKTALGVGERAEKAKP